MKGAYFALVTIALTEAAVYVASNWKAIGANNGLSLPIAHENNFAMLQFTSEKGYFYVILVLLLLFILFTQLVGRPALRLSDSSPCARTRTPPRRSVSGRLPPRCTPSS